MTIPYLEGSPEMNPPSQAPLRQSPIPGVTWGWRDLLLGVGLAVLAYLVLGFAVIGTAQVAWGKGTVEALFAEALTVLLLDAILIASVLVVIGRKGAGWRELGFRGPKPGIVLPTNNPWTGLLVLVVVGYFAAIAAVNFYSVAIELIGASQLLPDQQLGDNYYEHDSVIIATGLAVVFAAPVAEEVFFRGFLFAGLRRYLSLPIAGMSTGVLFAMAHGQVGLVIPFALVGAILAFAYERSGTLLAPIGIHFVFNAVSFMLLLLVPELR